MNESNEKPEMENDDGRIDKHTERLMDEYPRPLNWMLVEMADRNWEHWLNGPKHRRRTYGAESIREQGLTNNQVEWATEIADRMDGGHWMCPFCQVVNVAEEKPMTCDECGGDELVEAEVRYV